ncbi:MAG: S1-like domain-containing RNA-binding protein [Bacteroidota bacterium]|nr:S1-like domain-containing RNA-binding protein [Bacteroidota bacterium]
MIQIGIFNTLKVNRESDYGVYLADSEGNEVLLPNKYVRGKSISVGDDIDVFIYRDSEDRLVASTEPPLIQLNQFGYLQAKEVTQIGAFLDWGMERDLFVPFREQMRKMEAGRFYTVYMYLDENTDRLVASSKINKFFDNTNHKLKEGEEVDILVWDVAEPGVRVIINNKYKGLIYHNEIFTHISQGEKRTAYIKTVREDFQLDVSLEKPGYEAVEPNAQKILEVLNDAEGFLPLSDKSEPEQIYRELGMSKKLFKKAIGALYKQKLIRIEEDGIYLIK